MKPPADRERGRKHYFRIGLYVLIALIVLEILDYLVAQFVGGSIPILLVLALVNAAIIVQYFMHIGELFSDEESH